MTSETPAAATGTPGFHNSEGGKHRRNPEAWTGWILFGAMMMILLGTFQAIAGLVALFNDGYYLVGPAASWSTSTTRPGAGSI